MDFASDSWEEASQLEGFRGRGVVVAPLPR